jgi:hypothetical protein
MRVQPNKALPLLALLLACTPSFQAQEDVVDLRVLGIKAEPPEALVDGTLDSSGNLLVSGVEDVQITALVVDPVHPSTSAGVQPTLCLPSDGARCTVTAVDLVPVAQPQQEISFSLQHQIQQGQLPALLQLLGAAVQDDKLKGRFGVKVQLMLGVDTGDPAGVQTALKTLVFSPKTSDGNPNRNHNPTATGLHVIELDGYTVTQTLPPGLQPESAIQLKVGVQVGLRPTLGDGSIEKYDTYDLSGNLVHLTEGLSWDFYTTAGGDLDRSAADEPLPGVGDPKAGLVRFQALQAGSGVLWAVVRDGRGGQAWTRHPWVAAR